MMHILIITMGFGAGLVMSALGATWGIICIPTLIVFGVDPIVAKGSVLTSEIGVAIVSSSIHRKFGYVRSELVLALLLGVIGSITGSWISSLISSQNLGFLIGIFEVIIGFTILIKKSLDIIKDVKNSKDLTIVMVIGFIAGFVKGFLGGGWGLIGVSLLILIGVIAHEAIASSIVSRIAISSSAALIHIAMNAINWNYIALLTIGGVIGAITGAFIMKKLESKILSKIVGFIVVVLGILTLMK